MKRVLLLAEGPSEETFVKRILAPHLEQHNVYITPKILVTKKNMAGRAFKGGVTSYGKIKNDISNLLQDTNATVTTLLDYYGLPDDFPGADSSKKLPAQKRVSYLQDHFKQDIGSQRLIPFLALHEFEAWIFCCSDTVSNHFNDASLKFSLDKIISSVMSPEEINNNPETHPSARLTKLVPRYKKTIDGPRILEKIGLSEIRKQCSHFNSWLTALENLGNDSELNVLHP